MKIIHICLSSFYIDGMNYQENALVREHVALGHEVLVVASTENRDSDLKLSYSEPGRYLGTDGAEVVRLPYRFWPHTVAAKLRRHKGVTGILRDYRPDVIMYHGMSGPEIGVVARYVRDNPHVVFYADNHGDAVNSAKGFLSREILHKRYYARAARRALPQIQQVLNVSLLGVEFMRDFYRIPSERLSLMPLAGEPIDAAERKRRGAATRDAYGIAANATMFLQSGKFTPAKKLSNSLRAFSSLTDPDARFLISGALFDETREEAEALIASDQRIEFVGWKTPGELSDLLCATDVYVQPGTQSATMQNAVCCGCAAIIDDIPGHRLYDAGNLWFVRDEAGLKNAMAEALADPLGLRLRQSLSLEFAAKTLSYRAQAERLLHPYDPADPRGLLPLP